MSNHYIEIITWNRKMILLYGEKLTGTQRAIGCRSNGLHVELRFSDRYGRISFSCTLADGCGCCRFKMINYSHPYRQSRVRIAVTAEQEARLFAEACRMADVEMSMVTSWTKNPDSSFRDSDSGIYYPNSNKCVYGPDAIKYDKNGARFSFISKLRVWRMHPDDMICNEAVANVMLVVWPDLLTCYTRNGTGGYISNDPATLTPDQFEYLVRHYFDNLTEERKVWQA